MVAVKTPHSSFTSKDRPDLDVWLESVAGGLPADEREAIRRACEFAEPRYAGKADPTGAPMFDHVLGTASILAGQKMGFEMIAAAVLHELAEDDPASIAAIEAAFGADIARLVEGVARMGLIREYGAAPVADEKEHHAQLESLRKMLLAMVEDIRVVLIKLAERTQTMRSLSHADEEVRRRTAQETRDIFAPLANRLGAWQVKWELEDLAFRYLEPETYKKIARLLDERRIDREQYIANVIASLKGELAKHGIAAEVNGRAKHIYSIYKKMKRKNVGFGEVYDVRAVRVLVEDVKDCYAALGIVHSLWLPISGEFDDYISHPKGNFYRSLHTAVVGPEGKALEIQIRTEEMHRHSEMGVAAHWRYKEGGKQDAKFEEKIAWLRQILEWKEDVHDAGELMDQFKTELFQDTIYVLTPQGRVIDLPKGATPVDFAYQVHTDLGHRCRGAKVDGSIVPLNYKLATGQRVEILTAKEGGPSRDWLSPALGYAQSPRTRAKIRHWFKHQHFDENMAQGRETLEREAHRLGLPVPNQEKLAQKFHFPRVEELLAAVGRGEIAHRQLVAAIQEEAGPKEKPEAWQPPVVRPSAPTAAGVLVEGVGSLLTALAKCCKPVPPDPVVGFVTRGRGVAIHRQNCTNVLHLDEAGRERLLAASWGKTGAGYEVDIEVDANDRQGLLRDISEVFTREKISVTATNSLSRGLHARMRFTVRVADLGQLNRVLALIREVPGVSGAARG